MSGGHQEQHRRILLRDDAPVERLFRRRWSNGQAGLPFDVEGYPSSERSSVHHQQRHDECGRRFGQVAAKQRVHHRQTQRRGAGHALPVAQTGQRHLDSFGIENAAG